jgi:DNA-binding NarL/FixJ family response regulator
MKGTDSISNNGGTRVPTYAAVTNTTKASRAFVAAENILLRETLARVLSRCSDIEVAGVGSVNSELPGILREKQIQILLLCGRGNVEGDLQLIQKLRSEVPNVRTVLMHRAKTEEEFLECVRAGIQGYLTADASAREVVDSIRRIHAGEAVCPGPLCLHLFRYIERGAMKPPSRRHLLFTHRQHQLVTFVEEGLSNREIANRLSLSEQTIKNHLYRMKKKIGAENRVGIVDACRMRGLLA